jgi:hypothetical protein
VINYSIIQNDTGESIEVDGRLEFSRREVADQIKANPRPFLQGVRDTPDPQGVRIMRNWFDEADLVNRRLPLDEGDWCYFHDLICEAAYAGGLVSQRTRRA